MRNRLLAMTLLLAFLAGCQKYEIKYVGQMQITEQKIKLPDVGAPGHYDKAVGNNTAFHFTLENMVVDDFMKADDTYTNDFTSLEAFICGENNIRDNLKLCTLFFRGTCIRGWKA